MISNNRAPLVQIHTFGNSEGSRLISMLAGQLPTPLDYPSIGEVTGFGLLRIDSRPVQSGMLHSGSRIEVGEGSCARAELGSLGQITLSAGSDLSIAADSDMLYAKLNAGTIKVELPAGVAGVIEAANRIVMNQTNTDVIFTVRTSGDKVVVEAPDGYVVQDQVVTDAGEYEIAFLTRREEKMKPNRSLELQVKVTDKQQRPRPGTTVLFNSNNVSGDVSSTFSQTSSVTDANGIARTSISVGPKNGQAIITASIPGSLATATMTIKVQGGLIFGFNTVQAVTIAGVAAATAVGVRQGVVNNNNDRARREAAAGGNQIQVIGRD